MMVLKTIVNKTSGIDILLIGMALGIIGSPVVLACYLMIGLVFAIGIASDSDVRFGSFEFAPLVIHLLCLWPVLIIHNMRVDGNELV